MITQHEKYAIHTALAANMDARAECLRYMQWEHTPPASRYLFSRDLARCSMVILYYAAVLDGQMGMETMLQRCEALERAQVNDHVNAGRSRQMEQPN